MLYCDLQGNQIGKPPADCCTSDMGLSALDSVTAYEAGKGIEMTAKRQVPEHWAVSVITIFVQCTDYSRLLDHTQCDLQSWLAIVQ